MTSKFKALTANTPPLSSDVSTGAKAGRSKQSVSSDNTLTYMQTTKPPSLPMLSTDKKGSTTPLTTEKTRQHATLAKVALNQLEKAGLIKRFKVLSVDLTTVQKIRIEFDMSLWSDDLELK